MSKVNMTNLQTHRKVYFDSRSNETRKAGDSISNAALAKTLRKLARSEDFVDEFYTGTLGEKIVKKIKKLGGILTEEDMANYTAIWTPPTYYDITSTYEIFSAGKHLSTGWPLGEISSKKLL